MLTFLLLSGVFGVTEAPPTDVFPPKDFFPGLTPIVISLLLLFKEI